MPDVVQDQDKEVRCALCTVIGHHDTGWHAVVIEGGFTPRTYFACPRHFPAQSEPTTDKERLLAYIAFVRRAMSLASCANAN